MSIMPDMQKLWGCTHQSRASIAGRAYLAATLQGKKHDQGTRCLQQRCHVQFSAGMCALTACFDSAQKRCWQSAAPAVHYHRRGVQCRLTSVLARCIAPGPHQLFLCNKMQRDFMDVRAGNLSRDTLAAQLP